MAADAKLTATSYKIICPRADVHGVWLVALGWLVGLRRRGLFIREGTFHMGGVVTWGLVRDVYAINLKTLYRFSVALVFCLVAVLWALFALQHLFIFFNCTFIANRSEEVNVKREAFRIPLVFHNTRKSGSFEIRFQIFGTFKKGWHWITSFHCNRIRLAVYFKFMFKST